MAQSKELTDVLVEIDKDTTAVANRIDSLLSKIKTGMSQAEVSAVVGTLSGISTRLKATAHDPDEPVSPEPLPPPPP